MKENKHLLNKKQTSKQPKSNQTPKHQQTKNQTRKDDETWDREFLTTTLKSFVSLKASLCFRMTRNLTKRDV